jgi:CRISPR-associated endonuclease/helicase Cas3
MGTVEFYAHSENDEGNKHILREHLHETARIAESFALNEKDKEILKVAGLLHDLGKYQIDFQQYLLNGGQKGSVPHAAMGAGYAKKIRQLEISFAIDGHHKGLPDRSKWKNDIGEFADNENQEYKVTLKNYFSDTGLSEHFFEAQSIRFETPLAREIYTRYIFSSLTDADWLDTEKHFDSLKSEYRIRKVLDISYLQEKLLAEILNKSKEGYINQLRNRIRNEVIGMSESEIGFFSLNIPTGMGKTLLSVDWALRHAKKNGLNRIIIVLPFINIIDQTAKQLKDIFGEEWVLEHHSGYNETTKSDENSVDMLDKCKQLACENWDYPIIVTTSVQFFESLFSNHKSRCRKFHNIAKSVVIFDEVQTIPKEIIIPTLSMLKNIQNLMKTSFLFCTATLPAFEQREKFDGIENIQPLIQNPAMLFQETNRVKYIFLKNFEPVSPFDLIDELLKNTDSVLCVFNTKKMAKECFEVISGCQQIWEKVYHLSTGMCATHRKETVASIKDDLDAKRKIFVSSTQLIEAGVDFDFPCVFREMAPLESIIQTAGRCNREGKLPDLGVVTLFRLEGSSMPDKSYKVYTEYALSLLKDNKDFLYSYGSYGEYYRKVIALFTDPDKYKINDKREKFEFEAVSGSYKIIDKPTVSVFIYRYDGESIDVFNSIQYKPALSKADYRRMQTYSVQVYQSFLYKNVHLYQELPQGVLVWYGAYDKNTGISTGYSPPDESIV